MTIDVNQKIYFQWYYPFIMTAQMIFALTYVPCVACVGISYAFEESKSK